MARIEFHNSTALSGTRLGALCREGLSGWAVGTVAVHVRYSRGADFSGTCFYAHRRIYVNIGRHLAYPYFMRTNLARARTVGRCWYKPDCTIELQDGYQVVVFVFMHELYHLLVKRARRNTRQKESMCDRFAARFVVERFGAVVRGPDGKRMQRSEWDFQDLDGFVAAARDGRVGRGRAITIRPATSETQRRQLTLFTV